MKRVTVTFLTLLLAVFLTALPAHAQLVQSGKVVSSTSNCATTTQTTGNSTYLTVDNLGRQCVVISPTSNSNGLAVVDAVTTPGLTSETTAVGTAVYAINIDTSPGQTYGVTADDVGGTSGTVVWLNFFNATGANVTPGTTTPLFSLPVVSQPLTSSTDGVKVIQPFGSAIGIPFSTALSFTCTTLKNGTVRANGGLSAGCHVVVLRK